MAATQQRRDGIGALSTHLAISRAIVDRGASNAARINGAETRAEAQLDDVIATIGGRIYAAAANHTDQCASGEAGRSGSASPASTGRRCTECGCETSGATSAAGIRWSTVCQHCKDMADGLLERRLVHTSELVAKLGEAIRKPKPPVMVDDMKLVCTCGDDEFTEVAREPDDDEVGLKGHRGGYECDNCGKFFERAAIDRDD